MRNIVARGGGSLGDSGCVAWLFESRGLITVETNERDPEELALEAIDAGAEDVKVADDCIEIYTRPEELVKVREALEQKEMPLASTDLSMVPKTIVELEEKAAVQMLKLLDKLEELDEVQDVTTNADFPETVVEKQG